MFVNQLQREGKLRFCDFSVCVFAVWNVMYVFCKLAGHAPATVHGVISLSNYTLNLLNDDGNVQCGSCHEVCTEVWQSIFRSLTMVKKKKKSFKHARLCCKTNIVGIHGCLSFAVCVCDCLLFVSVLSLRLCLSYRLHVSSSLYTYSFNFLVSLL